MKGARLGPWLKDDAKKSGILTRVYILHASLPKDKHIFALDIAMNDI